MICAYCKKDKKATREHIIPRGIIDLFPECEYVFSERDGEVKFYKDESKIKDVCSGCNNGVLSRLDDYGIEFIKKYFVIEFQKGDILEVNYNYNKLTRWLLKIIYNNDRALKKPTDWFEDNIEYIMGKRENPKYHMSVFGGLFVNVSPIPLFWLNNIQMNIINDPILVMDSILKPTDSIGLVYEINKEFKQLEIQSVYKKYLIRFGGGMFLILLWREDSLSKNIRSYEKLINYMFPYKLFRKEWNAIYLKRCTHAYNIPVLGLIDNDIGISFADQTNSFLTDGSSPEVLRQILSQDWDDHIKKIREGKKAKKKSKKKRR